MPLKNRRIFQVSSETHFPFSVFVGETGFELLSARRDQRRRRHGRKDPISKNLEKSSTFCEKSFMHRHFPATSWLPTAPSCTPNNPPCTPGAPWVDSDRRRWDSAFFGFPPFPPTRTPHPTTPYTLRTLDHRPDSESQPQPPFFHLARQTPRSSVLVHFKKPAPWGGGVTRRWNVLSRMYWPVTHPGRNLTFKRLLLTFHFFFLFCRGWWRRGGCWLC